jgi:lysozyme family protein
MTQDEARTTLNAMSMALTAQRAKATDPAARQALLDQINQIEDQLDSLAVLDAQQTAQAIDQATDRLEALMMTAQVNPFDAAIQRSFKAVADKAVQAADNASQAFVAQEFKATEKDAPEVVVDFTPPAPAGVAPAPVPAPVAGELPPIVNGSTLAQLAHDYTLCWAVCRINPDKQSQVAAAADQMLKGRARYAAVSARTNGVPWQLIGIMHGRECGYDFFKHLHNGDSLAAPTHQVPAGRPPGWDGTGTWEDSAVDAVHLKFANITNWSLPPTLYALESFNGFGYRPQGVRSPYLWSFSNLYTKGRYVADHVFDPESVSKQVGSALILKVLEQRGLWP